MILYTAELLSPEECRALIDAFERHVGASTERDFSGQPVVRWPAFDDARDVVEKCWNAACDAATWITHRMGLCPERVETTILTRMGPGGWHAPHADNCRRDGSGNWVPNHTPHRTHTAIVYLNTVDFGGQLVFLGHGIEIRPRGGHIVVFPADGEHEHGVEVVHTGVRYSLAMWLTADRARAEAA